MNFLMSPSCDCCGCLAAENDFASGIGSEWTKAGTWTAVGGSIRTSSTNAIIYRNNVALSGRQCVTGVITPTAGVHTGTPRLIMGYDPATGYYVFGECHLNGTSTLRARIGKVDGGGTTTLCEWKGNVPAGQNVLNSLTFDGSYFVLGELSGLTMNAYNDLHLIYPSGNILPGTRAGFGMGAVGDSTCDFDDFRLFSDVYPNKTDCVQHANCCQDCAPEQMQVVIAGDFDPYSVNAACREFPGTYVLTRAKLTSNASCGWEGTFSPVYPEIYTKYVYVSYQPGVCQVRIETTVGVTVYHVLFQTTSTPTQPCTDLADVVPYHSHNGCSLDSSTKTATVTAL
jgi:hypothetical protein